MTEPPAAMRERFNELITRLRDDKDIEKWKPFHDWLEAYLAMRGYAPLTNLDLKAAWQAAQPSSEQIEAVARRLIEAQELKYNDLEQGEIAAILREELGGK